MNSRTLRRRQERKNRKMDIKFPLVKTIEIVTVEDDIINQNTGERSTSYSEIISVVRDDGVSLLSLLSQIDWNDPKFKEQRRDMRDIMKKMRAWNFSNSTKKDSNGSIDIEWGQAEKMKKILCDDYPSKLPIQGVNILDSLEELQDWFDIKKAEITKSKKPEISTDTNQSE